MAFGDWQRLRIAIVYLPQVVSPLKYYKEGMLAGVVGDFGMVRDILKTVSLYELVSQIVHLMRLRVGAPIIC